MIKPDYEDKNVKLYCGDCLDILPQLPDNSVDAVVTDPPYGINYQSNGRVKSPKFAVLENDDNDLRLVTFSYIHKLLRENCVFAGFASFKNYADDFIEAKKYFNIKNCVVWNKGGGGIGDLTHSLSTDYALNLLSRLHLLTKLYNF